MDVQVRRNRVSGKTSLRRKAYRPRRASTRKEEREGGERKQSEWVEEKKVSVEERDRALLMNGK
jgi:hypothetical protein